MPFAMTNGTLSPTPVTVNGGTPFLDASTLSRYRQAYLWAWLLSLVVMLIELTGAMVSGSLALRADVWHVAGDMLIAIAPLAVSYARERSINLDRTVLLAGIVVAVTLIIIGGVILAEARTALSVGTPPHEVHGWLLSGFSLLSGVVNLIQTRTLSRIHVTHRDVTHVGFQFHVRMDLLKNLALPSLGLLLALHLAPQRSDSWAAAGIGVWIAMRGLALLIRSATALRGRRASLRY
jgi:cobalt-zinc-cadmium efflux system protein